MFEHGGLGSEVVLERMLIDERNKIRENHVRNNYVYVHLGVLHDDSRYPVVPGFSRGILWFLDFPGAIGPQEIKLQGLDYADDYIKKDDPDSTKRPPVFLPLLWMVRTVLVKPDKSKNAWRGVVRLLRAMAEQPSAALRQKLAGLMEAPPPKSSIGVAAPAPDWKLKWWKDITITWVRFFEQEHSMLIGSIM